MRKHITCCKKEIKLIKIVHMRKLLLLKGDFYYEHD